MFADLVPDPDEALHDAHWMLRFASAFLLQIGILRLLMELPFGAHIALSAVALFGLSLIHKFWIRFLLLACGAAALGVDFFFRRNVFSLVFMVPLAWHAAILLLSKNNLAPQGENPAA